MSEHFLFIACVPRLEEACCLKAHSACMILFCSTQAAVEKTQEMKEYVPFKLYSMWAVRWVITGKINGCLKGLREGEHDWSSNHPTSPSILYIERCAVLRRTFFC